MPSPSTSTSERPASGPFRRAHNRSHLPHPDTPRPHVCIDAGSYKKAGRHGPVINSPGVTEFPPAAHLLVIYPSHNLTRSPHHTLSGGHVGRVLVVDDDPGLRLALCSVFTAADFDCVEAQDSDEALLRFTTEQPDLVVLDVSMPGLDGYTLCERIRSESSVPILMLTGRGEVADRVQGLKRGADDYVVKPVAAEELLARTRALLRRTDSKSSTLVTFADITLDSDSRLVWRGDELIRLTRKEFEVLQLLMERPQQVVSREQLCLKIWGHQFDYGSNFIDVTVKDLRRALEAGGKPRLVHTVRGFGYALREAPL